MATANSVFVSPGVYTSERDLSFVAQSVGVTTLGLVGETLQGPAFEPVFIRNFDEFQLYFGGTNPTKFVNTQIPKYEAAYIAKAYLQQSNQLFVTRILGLSGYDAGPSWSIKTISNPDVDTVALSSNLGTFGFTFVGTTASTSSISITLSGGGASSYISSVTGNTVTFANGTTSTVLDEIEGFAFDIISDNTLSGDTAYVYGSLSAGTFNALTAAGFTELVNVFGCDNLNASSADLTAVSNDTWYYSLFELTNDTYTGLSFTSRISTLTTNGTGSYTGTCVGFVNSYTADTYSDSHNLVVGTFRSRGVSLYNDNNNPTYEVTGTTDVVMLDNLNGISQNPFNNFTVSGITKDAVTFSFQTSFQSSNTDFVGKVFGRSNFNKDRTEVPLFIEEEYSGLMATLYNQGKIRGLSTSLVSFDSAQSLDPDTIGWYCEQYQTPSTPYVVSELRGDIVERLFRFISISDGNNANRQIKISLVNMSFANNNFDILVRDFYDTDENPVVLERFANCTMDVSSPSYIALKVGTANGEYELKSKYIMLEIVEGHPVDALPCGFEGYISRNYSTNISPFLVYKTQYYTPGQLVYTPPFNTPVLTAGGGASSVRSSGDKVRRTYLGLSNVQGYDADFFSYKGKQLPDNIATDTTSADWTYLTQGFHMDINASAITIPSIYVTSGQTAYQCGVATFQAEPTSSTSPYYKIYSRKFTLLPAGGFDGWDIYREYRTNADAYQLGDTKYLLGAAATAQFPDASGWGAFKKITDGENTEWANTDYYAYLKGFQTFNNPASVNINVFVTPGIDYVNNLALVQDAIDIVEQDRADSIYITTTPDYDMFVATTSDPEDFIYPTDAVVNLEDSDIDSNYTATYYPWILVKDSVNNTNLWIPPTSEVVRNLALTDNIAFPWFASAGYSRGLVNAVKARRKLTQEDRDILYQGRLNPIATFSDVGPVIWGNKTLQVRESALDRINVRRLLLQARKLISAVAVRLLFEQNDQQVRQDFLDAVNPILDGIRRDRGLTDFRVTVSSSPEDIDRNQLTGKIYIKPTRSLEFIDIEFVITPTGASFENI
jgi:hypothetical protein